VAAAEALWLVDRNADGVGELVGALHADDVLVAEHAAETLVKLGPAAKDGVPALLQLLKDPYDPRYDLAAEALKKIDAKAAKKAGAL
jgi:HEAT repeat protein